MKIQDFVYSGLRKIAPTKREMEQTRKALESMKFSITTKVHLLFDHAACEQVRGGGGLGDNKIEDHLKKHHQTQLCCNNIFNRTSDTKKFIHKMQESG